MNTSFSSSRVDSPVIFSRINECDQILLEELRDSLEGEKCCTSFRLPIFTGRFTGSESLHGWTKVRQTTYLLNYFDVRTW